jgi:hypothetical protein
MMDNQSLFAELVETMDTIKPEYEKKNKNKNKSCLGG